MNTNCCANRLSNFFARLSLPRCFRWVLSISALCFPLLSAAQTVTYAFAIDDAGWPIQTFGTNIRALGLQYDIYVPNPPFTREEIVRRPDGSVALDTGTGTVNVSAGGWAFWDWYGGVNLNQVGKWGIDVYINGSYQATANFNVVGPAPQDPSKAKYSVQDLSAAEYLTLPGSGGPLDPSTGNITNNGLVAAGNMVNGGHYYVPYCGLVGYTADGNSTTNVLAINNNEQSVGEVLLNGSYSAYMYDRSSGNVTYYGLPGYLYSWALGISDQGAVVGNSSSGQAQAFIGFGGKTKQLIEGFGQTAAEAMSRNGLVAGFYGDLTGFVWTPTNAKADPTVGSYQTVPTDDEIVPLAVNDLGHSAGIDLFADESFVWTGGGSYETISVPGGSSSEAWSINDKDEVVGSFELPGYVAHAFYYNAQTHAVYDLNSLIDPSSGWVLNSASGINDAGQIVGQGTYEGVPQAFLITPLTFKIEDLTPTANSAYGYYINANQAVSGIADNRAFIASVGSGINWLSTPTGTAYAYPSGISDAGLVAYYTYDSSFNYLGSFVGNASGDQPLSQVVGSQGYFADALNGPGDILYQASFGPPYGAYVFKDGVSTELPSGFNPFLLNNSDEMVGSIQTGSSFTWAVYSDGVTTPLPSYLQTGLSYPLAISNTGLIAGATAAPDSDGTTGWTLTPGGAFTDLGTLRGLYPPSYSWCAPETINSLGHAAGISDTPGGWGQAFFFDGASMIAANSLHDTQDAWQLSGILSMNDGDDATGEGYHLGADHAFRMRRYPVISGVNASSVTTSSATIRWSTELQSSSTVEYGTSTSYGQTLTGGFGPTHSVTLSRLIAGTTYHFRVISQDKLGRQALSADHSFTTLKFLPRP